LNPTFPVGDYRQIAARNRAHLTLGADWYDNRQAIVLSGFVMAPEEEEKPKEVPAEKQWDNPENPEKAADLRDIEQMERQKKEAEARKANLTDNETTN
jgi:hypothetical protein